MTNENKDSWLPLTCFFADGHTEEYGVPKEMLETSESGGKGEMNIFRTRLKAGRDAAEANPRFRASFGQLFHPVVINIACLFIVKECLMTLVGKLSNVDEADLSALKASCKYPYLRVSSESSDFIKVAVEPNVISLEAMSTEFGNAMKSPLAARGKCVVFNPSSKGQQTVSWAEEITPIRFRIGQVDSERFLGTCRDQFRDQSEHLNDKHGVAAVLKASWRSNSDVLPEE